MQDIRPGVELDTSVGYLLKETASALRAAMEAVLRPLGMTITRYSCLELLAQRPGLSSADLARGTFVTRQSMHALLQALERDGLVERATVAGTGRALPTRITPAGEAQLREASAAVRAVEDRMRSRLDDEQVDRVRELLRAMRDGLGS